jgi:hypothetical protein
VLRHHAEELDLALLDQLQLALAWDKLGLPRPQT